MAPTETITVEDAKRRLRQDYWDSVRSFAEDAESEVKNGNITSEDEYREYIEQSVDGSSWIIYTANTLQVLCWTDNDDAYEEIGLDGCDDAYAIYTRMAYCAMLADVMDTASSFDDLTADDSEDEEV